MTATAAVARAVNGGARVINMSFRWHPERERTEVGGIPVVPGGAGFDTFGLALRAASMLGVVAVTAAGNCGDDGDSDQDGIPNWQEGPDEGGPDCSKHNAEKRPAIYDDVITVAGIKRDGVRVDSSTANAHVDVAAPGASIRLGPSAA